jgi:hypothetical protein
LDQRKNVCCKPIRFGLLNASADLTSLTDVAGIAESGACAFLAANALRVRSAINRRSLRFFQREL